MLAAKENGPTSLASTPPHPIHRSQQKDALVELAASGLLPEFRQHLLGKKSGDQASFSVTYPSQFGNELFST